MLILDGCLAVVASLCMNANGTAEIQRSAIWSGAVLRLGNATVTSMIASDSVVLPLARDMRRLCVNGKCFFYRGHCNDSAARKCVLWYSFATKLPLRKIELTGDALSVTRALHELKLVRSAKALVPLSNLRLDARTDLPPTCYARDGSC